MESQSRNLIRNLYGVIICLAIGRVSVYNWDEYWEVGSEVVSKLECLGLLRCLRAETCCGQLSSSSEPSSLYAYLSTSCFVLFVSRLTPSYKTVRIFSIIRHHFGILRVILKIRNLFSKRLPRGTARAVKPETRKKCASTFEHRKQSYPICLSELWISSLFPRFRKIAPTLKNPRH